MSDSHDIPRESKVVRGKSESGMDTLQSFGRGYTLISAVFITILCVFGIIYGIYCIYRKPRTEVQGKVTKVSSGNTKKDFITVSFSYNDRYYNTTISEDADKYTVGDNVTVYFINTDDPREITLDSLPSKTDGGIIIGICVVVIILKWIWYHFVSKSDNLAAFAGVAGGIEMMRY